MIGEDGVTNLFGEKNWEENKNAMRGCRISNSISRRRIYAPSGPNAELLCRLHKANREIDYITRNLTQREGDPLAGEIALLSSARQTSMEEARGTFDWHHVTHSLTHSLTHLTQRNSVEEF